MGNLRQESNYNPADQPSGLGIAQWLGVRRDLLIKQGRYTELGTQLNFLVFELKQGSEKAAYQALLKATTLEEATLVFQNMYERCNPAYCNPEKRIEYAKDIFNRY